MDDRDIHELIKGLGSDDYDVIHDAVEKLVEIGEPAVPYIIDALKDENSNIRKHAAAALGSIAEEYPECDLKEAVIPLIETLKDEDRSVQNRVAWALDEIGDERAVPLLIEALKDCGKYERNNIAITLSKIDEERAVPLLIEILKGDKKDVYWEGLEILNKLNKILEKSIKEENHPTALMILKALALEIIKKYDGRKDRDSLKEKREKLTELESLTQKIHDKMNPDKKKFPVKHQSVKRTQVRKVTTNG